MTAPSFPGPTLRKGLIRKLRVTPTQLSSSGLAAQVVEAPPPGYAVVVRRLLANLYAAGQAFGGVGADDNLVLRATDASGVILTQAITGVGFLDTAITAYKLAVAQPVNDQLPVAAAAVVLAYGASADGITVTNATGWLDVLVEYDLVFVGLVGS